MSALQTTRDLNREIIEAFRRSQFDSASEIRQEAIHHFERLGFPGNKTEEYRFTPISKGIENTLLSNSFGTIVPSDLEDISPFLIPGFEANYLVFVNGRYSTKLSRLVSPPDQLTIQSLPQALNEQSELVRSHFAHLVDAKIDAFVAFNTAFWQDGVFLHVPT